MAFKTTRILLAGSARTTSSASNPQISRRSAFLRLFLNVTVASGSGGLLPVVRGYDPVSGESFEMTTGGRGPVTQTGLYVYEMRPETIPEPFGSVLERVNDWLPNRWDVLVKHGDESSYTYSVGCEEADG